MCPHLDWRSGLVTVAGSLFEKMVFLYWPTIVLVAKLLGTSGEGAMIAVPIYGMALGMLLYGMIIGLLVSYVKTRTH